MTRLAVSSVVTRCVFIVVAALAAQRDLVAQVTEAGASTGVIRETYTFASPGQVDLDRISLITIPVNVRASLTRSLELGVSGAYASATMTRSAGTETSVAGPTDTELRLTYAMPGDRVRLSAIGLVPTGKSKVTATEMDLMGVIASDLLPFAISNWGSGGGLGLGASFAKPVGDLSSIGVSGGYVVARSYQPLDATTFAYRPGNQLQARVAADHRFGGAAKGSLQLSYLHFGQDQAAGTNFYQSGDRLQAVGSLAFASGANGTGLVYAGYLRRQQGQYTDAVRVTPAQDLLYAGCAFRQSVGSGGVVLVPSLDARVLGNQSGFEQGNTLSAGLGVEIPMGALQLRPAAKARFGNLTVRSGQSSGFSGVELSVGVATRAGMP